MEVCLLLSLDTAGENYDVTNPGVGRKGNKKAIKLLNNHLVKVQYMALKCIEIK